MKNEKIKNSAIIPGSFDPLTLGHLDVIERVSRLSDFDVVYVALLINPDKNYLFDTETRVKIAENACLGLPNVRVISDDGLLGSLCERLGTNVIIKGVRNARDFEYELKMAEWNKAHFPSVETLFLPCDPALSDISSTRVRALLAEKKYDEVEKLLPRGTLHIITAENGGKKQK